MDRSWLLLIVGGQTAVVLQRLFLHSVNVAYGVMSPAQFNIHRVASDIKVMKVKVAQPCLTSLTPWTHEIL